MTTAAVLAQMGSNNTTFRNRIINPGMVIDQRNAGASVTANDGTFVVDRFKYVMSQNSKGTSQQSTTAPSNYINSIQFTSSSAYTVGSSEYFLLTHSIEGYNIADLGWGTAAAQPVTLSFQVRSSLTGTFGGAVENGTRFYPFSYTINAANTWETKTITIAGDTSGTWLTGNGLGVRIRFSLGAGATVSGTAGSWGGTTYYSATGATSVVGTNGATFYITGVQLEAGTNATPFEFRPYGTELALCQRYFVNTTEAACMSNINSRYLSVCTRLNPVPMRATPSVSVSGTYTFNPFFGSGLYTSSNAPYLQRNVNDNFIINFDMGASTGTSGFGEIYNATLSISAEL